MAPLTIASRALARTACKTAAFQPVRALSTTPALRDGDATTGTYNPSAYHSPFKGETRGTKIPNWGSYMSKGSTGTNNLMSYFMVGTMGAITAAGAKSTVQGEFPLPCPRRFWAETSSPPARGPPLIVPAGDSPSLPGC